MITIKAIRVEASPQSFTKGNQLYRRGMVEDLNFQNIDGKLEASAWVEGSYDNRYQVEMAYSLKSHTFTQYYCECPAYQSYDGMCKHCVAVALEMMERDAEREEVSGEADRVSAAAPAVTPAAAARLKQPPTDTAVDVYKRQEWKEDKNIVPQQESDWPETAGGVELLRYSFYCNHACSPL